MAGKQAIKQNPALVHAAFVIVSGVMWVAVWLLNKYLFNAAQVATGISLIYIPAGFRLLIILVFGIWGSLGIFLFEPLIYFVEFPTGTLGQILMTAGISAFSPLLVATVFCRMAGIRDSLTELKPRHLPIIAFAMALVTPLLFNIFFVLSGQHPAEHFARDYLAMATGDFFGCLLVISTIKAIAWVLKSRHAGP